MFIKPLLETGAKYTVRLRKLDNTAKFCTGFPDGVAAVIEELTRRLNAAYSNREASLLEKMNKGDHVVFQAAPCE